MVYRGDGGVDVFNGTYGADGGVDVYQIKYFPGQWEETQKQQIRDSYETARENPDFKLKTWFLCVPTRLTKTNIRWFDEWRNGKEIELIDGDDLTDRLNQEECKQARQQLREWGVGGIQPTGARFSANAVVRRCEPARGLLFGVVIQIINEGDRTAKGIRVSIEHSEIGCVAGGHNGDHWEQRGSDRTVNPRRLSCRTDLHRQEPSAIMLINICERTEFPFSIKLKIWSEDANPVEMGCVITKEDFEKTTSRPQFIPLVLGGPSMAAATGTNPTRPKIEQPITQAAKEILGAILKNPNVKERGLTEILAGAPGNNLDAAFVATTTSHGGAECTLHERGYSGRPLMN